MKNIIIREVLNPELHYDVETDGIVTIGLQYDDAICLAFNRGDAGDRVSEIYASGREVIWQNEHWSDAAEKTRDQLAEVEAKWRKYGKKESDEQE
jgi:hypothetical protein